MTTGETAWIGSPPKVEVVERVLKSQLPQEDQDKFEAFAVITKKKIEYTRSGEPVFLKKDYTEWKRQ